MKEKILNLLALCLEAKEKGIDMFFDYAPHVQSIGIRAYEPNVDFLEDGNKPIINYHFYLDEPDMNKSIDHAEKLIKNSIKERA